MTDAQNQFFDCYRAILKATGDATRASLESAVRLRTKQLASIDEALATHARVVADINAAKGLDDLVAASGALAGAQFQALVSYWNGIYEAVGENQADVSRLIQAQVERMRDDFRGALGTAPELPVPMLSALQPLMEVASSAYVLTARATAEATKLAAAQLAAANTAAATEPARQAQQRSA